MVVSASGAPDWDILIAVLRSGPGSDARHDVGVWAMERVRAALGETWPQRWHQRFGHLPAFLSDPANNALAYAQLVEAGLRLDRLASMLRVRRLVKEWSSHLEKIRLVDVQLQLEVAALANSLGLRSSSRLRSSSQGFPGRPTLSCRLRGGQLITECFCVSSDQDTGESLAYDRDLGLRLTAHDLDVLDPAGEGSQYLKVTNAPNALCEIMISEHGSVTWEYRPFGGGPGPARITAMVLDLLGVGTWRKQAAMTISASCAPRSWSSIQPGPAGEMHGSLMTA